MSNNKQHSAHNNSIEKHSEEFFKKVEVSYTKSKDDVWNEMFADLEKKDEPKTIEMKNRWVYYAAAACILLLLSTGLTFRLYTKTIHCPPAKQLTAYLPDGSEVKLNAESDLSYQPLWWRFSRNVQFTGEGYFKVQKGNTFSVKGNNGTTTVLGTSFTVYDRENKFKVTCVSGKVLVEARATKDTTILTPNEKATLRTNGELEVEKNIETKESTAWIDNWILFTSTPIKDIFNEIARRYNVSIDLSNQKIDYDIEGSANFLVDELNIEDALNVVCIPYDLSFKKLSGNKYVITQKSRN